MTNLFSKHRRGIVIAGLLVAAAGIVTAAWWTDSSQYRSRSVAGKLDDGISRIAALNVDLEEVRYTTRDLEDGLKHVNKRVRELNSTISRLEKRMEEDLVALRRQTHNLNQSLANLKNPDGNPKTASHAGSSSTSGNPPKAASSEKKNIPPARKLADSSKAETKPRPGIHARDKKTPSASDSVAGTKSAGTKRDIKNNQLTSVATLETVSAKKPGVNRTPLREQNSESKLPKPDKRGRWVINLASIQDKDAANRFAENAKTRGIAVEQSSVTFKGRKFWRIQIAGFSSAEDARVFADHAKQKLGLKDTWVMRR